MEFELSLIKCGPQIAIKIDLLEFYSCLSVAKGFIREINCEFLNLDNGKRWRLMPDGRNDSQDSGLMYTWFY